MGSATTVVRHDMPELRVRDWVLVPLACVLGMAAAYLTLTDYKLPFQIPIDLTVHQDGADIRISWNRSATSGGGNLEIIDGTQHRAIFVPPDLTSVSYRASTTDVEVRLGRVDDPLRTEIARCLVRDPAPISLLDSQMAVLQTSAAALRQAFSRTTRRVTSLQGEADRLMAKLPPPPAPKPVVTKTAAARWWR